MSTGVHTLASSISTDLIFGTWRTITCAKVLHEYTFSNLQMAINRHKHSHKSIFITYYASVSDMWFANDTKIPIPFLLSSHEKTHIFLSLPHSHTVSLTDTNLHNCTLQIHNWPMVTNFDYSILIETFFIPSFWRVCHARVDLQMLWWHGTHIWFLLALNHGFISLKVMNEKSHVKVTVRATANVFSVARSLNWFFMFRSQWIRSTNMTNQTNIIRNEMNVQKRMHLHTIFTQTQRRKT